jgi:hypothetical protein
MPLSLALLCRSITAARQSQHQQADGSEDIGIERTSDVTAGNP